MPDGPINHPMKRGIGFAPRTDLHAGAAAGPLLISYPHTGAFLYIHRPPLITVNHDFVSFTDCPGRALTRAFFALTAKVLETKVDWPVHGQREIGSYHGSLETGAQKGIKNDISNTAHFSQSRP